MLPGKDNGRLEDRPVATVKKAITLFVQEVCPAQADGQVRRVAARFGLVAGAGELAGAFGILLWPDDEAKKAAAICFQAWLKQRGGIGAQEFAAGLAQVRHFFQTHEISHFQLWDSSDERIISNRVGFIRQKNDSHTLCNVSRYISKGNLSRIRLSHN